MTCCRSTKTLVYLPLRRSPDQPPFHLEGVQAGRRASGFKIDASTGEWLGLLATATVGEGGWVDLTKPIIVRAGEAFVAVAEQEPDQR